MAKYFPLPDERSGPTSLAAALDMFKVAHGLRDTNQTEERVLRAWREVAGPEIARQAPVVRVRGGEVLVEVTSAALHHELIAYRAADFEKALAAALPPNLFRRLVIKRRS